MKKLMFVAAIAAAMTGLADVEGANIVGYSSLAENVRKAQFFMLGLPLQDCGKTELDIQKDISTTASLGQYTTRETMAPRLMFWDAAYAGGLGQYVEYYYIEDAYDEDAEGPDNEDGEVPGWSDTNGDYLKDVTLPLGSAMWFVCPEETGKAATVSGQVSGEDDLSVTADFKGFTMFANPYPADINPNNVAFKMLNEKKEEIGDLAYGQYSTREEYAPRLMYWDSSYAGGLGQYVEYYYIEDAYDEDAEGPDNEDGEVPGWSDTNGDLVKDAVLPAAQGFWMYLPATTDDGETPAPWINGVRATFDSPLAK